MNPSFRFIHLAIHFCMAVLMKKTRKPLDPTTARKWSDIGHMAFIDALTSSAILKANQFAFHGGTSLHLSWQSPRFSEDLDFLLSKDMGEGMPEVMKRVGRRMLQILRASDPGFELEIREKTKAGSNLLDYMLIVSHKDVIGTAKVRAEFWQVEPGYLERYDTAFAYPAKDGDIVSRVSQPLPAATLEAAYADKLTAFATRRHLKWRDVFDLWWIGRQVDIEPAAMADRFLHHVTAFNTYDGLPPADALRKFLERGHDEIVKEADPDLKKWLPPQLWNTLRGTGVEEMVADVRASIEAIAGEIEARCPEVAEVVDGPGL
ncbi:nucleotidyl transferase AbiEii/AbiGii toxin family protein [Paracoccus litorisediminis]|uniref:nucleotidyl transferase AbiEii/AbiGii toxin family protein n=1 Tax=Paracoccus litorisediminis TaxID=2006130 RepID=UPI00372FFC4D